MRDASMICHRQELLLDAPNCCGLYVIMQGLLEQFRFKSIMETSLPPPPGRARLAKWMARHCLFDCYINFCEFFDKFVGCEVSI